MIEKEKLKERLKDEELSLNYAYLNFYNDEKIFIADDVYAILDELKEKEEPKC